MEWVFVCVYLFFHMHLIIAVLFDGDLQLALVAIRDAELALKAETYSFD